MTLLSKIVGFGLDHATWPVLTALLLTSFALLRICYLAFTAEISKKAGGPRGVLFDQWVKYAAVCCCSSLVVLVALPLSHQYRLPFPQRLPVPLWPVLTALIVLRFYVINAASKRGFVSYTSLIRQHSHPFNSPEQRTTGRVGLAILLADAAASLALACAAGSDLVAHSQAGGLVCVLASMVSLTTIESSITKRTQAGSALKESLKKKGENSYYYAHGSTPVSTDSSSSGHRAPIKRVTSPSSIAAAGAAVKEISEYSFLDDGTKVKVYIQMEGVNEDNVQLVWTRTSLRLEVKSSNGAHCLQVGTLNGFIEGCTIKVKPSKLILTLKKCTGSNAEWPKLAKELVRPTEEDGICIDGR